MTSPSSVLSRKVLAPRRKLADLAPEHDDGGITPLDGNSGDIWRLRTVRQIGGRRTRLDKGVDVRSRAMLSRRIMAPFL
jgi:hypothetical protein